MKLSTSLIVVAQLAFSTAVAAQQNPPKIEVDWAALKEESEARKAVADAHKAEAEAETAATKAKFGTLADVTTVGTTTVGDKAGQLEAAILSNAATRKVAARIVADVCVQAPSLCGTPLAAARQPDREDQAPPALPGACTGLDVADGSVRLYVVTEAERPSFDTAEVVQASLCGLERRLTRAIDASNGLRNGGAVTVMGPAAVFTIANMVGNLFRSDYAVQGVALTADDLLLAKAVVAASALSVKVPVALPSVYRPAALTSDNPLVRTLAGLDQLRAQAVQLGSSYRATAAALGKKGKAFAAKAAEQTEVANELDAAVKALDDYVAKVTTPSDKGVSELAEAARQARMRADLQAGSYMLALKMNAAGGSTVSRKNFWTFLGGVPFQVSGGTVASFTLIEGASGNAVGGGSYGVAGGFQSIGAVHRRKDVQ